MRRPPAIVLFVLGALACGGSPWRTAGAPSAPPDEQFRTGVEVGEDVYVWHCYEGTRVVVLQTSSACFGARPAQLYKGACGDELPIEKRYATEREAGAATMPESIRWPGTDGATSSETRK